LLHIGVGRALHQRPYVDLVGWQPRKLRGDARRFVDIRRVDPVVRREGLAVVGERTVVDAGGADAVVMMGDGTIDADTADELVVIGDETIDSCTADALSFAARPESSMVLETAAAAKLLRELRAPRDEVGD